MKIFPHNEDGLTLVEVVASIVIITIVLLSFSSIFIQANKTAAINNEKLVVVNLADAMLAKVQAKTYTKVESYSADDYFIDNSESNNLLKDPPLKVKLDDKFYNVSYSATQCTNADKPTNSFHSEKNLDLIKVVVTVSTEDGKIKGSTEGYVQIEE